MDDFEVLEEHYTTKAKLLEAVQAIPGDVRLYKNRVGNLSAVRDGVYVGYLDIGAHTEYVEV